MRNKKQKGFSLIELLIVVAIILIIAAIAIPNLIRSKMAANEASAVASLRTLNTTEILFTTGCNIGFSADLKTLGPDPGGTGQAPVCTGAGDDLVDAVMSGGAGGTATTFTKSGFNFVYAPGAAPIATYTITAVPVSVGGSGLRGFITDQTGVIHVNTATPLTPALTDPPL